MRVTIGVTALLTWLAGCAGTPDTSHADVRETRVMAIGKQLYVNGNATTLLGFQAGSAPLLDPWADDLLAQLDEWRRHGVNALTIWLQGTSGGYTTVFTVNGEEVSENVADVIARTGYGLKELPAVVGRTSGTAVVARAKRIVEAANGRGMVVILGIVHRSALSGSDTEETLTRAMRAAARAFKDHPNVIFNVWHEIDIGRPLERRDAIANYVAAVRAGAPGRLVCAGSAHSGTNLSLAALPGVDVVCHAAGRDVPEAMAGFEALRAIEKPVVNVELYGGSGGGYVDDATRKMPVPPGYALDFHQRGGWRRIYGAWQEEDYQDGTGRQLMGKRSYRGLIRYVAEDSLRQRHLMVHAAGWFQGASRTERAEQIGNARGGGQWTNVYHAGYQTGRGASDQPGIRWILEEFVAARMAAK